MSLNIDHAARECAMAVKHAPGGDVDEVLATLRQWKCWWVGAVGSLAIMPVKEALHHARDHGLVLEVEGHRHRPTDPLLVLMPNARMQVCQCERGRTWLAQHSGNQTLHRITVYLPPPSLTGNNQD